MTESVDRQTAAARLRAVDNILILCHKNPDGDTIGCAGALYHALTSIGKTAAVLCSDPIPEMYGYMQFACFEKSFTPAFVVAVDVAGIQLFGEKNNIQKYAEHVDLCIDHHASNSGYAYETLLDPGAAAACEPLMDVVKELGANLTPKIAECLYTGIATDTGCFRFSSTTAHTLRMAAKLIEAGADIAKLNNRLFECRSRARVMIDKLAMDSLEYFFDGQCAMICLTWEQIVSTGVPGAELEDLTSFPRSIEGVKVGLTLRQQKDGSFRISIRTGGEVDACSIARHLGGGGHTRAAGCEISGNLDNAKYAVLEEVKKELDRIGTEGKTDGPETNQ